MQQALRRSNLVPAGFVVESAFCDIETTVITSGHHKVLVLVLRAGLFRAAFIAITGVGSGTFRYQGGRSNS